MNENSAILIGSSGAVVYLMEWLKRSSWFPWLTQYSSQLNRIVAIISAAVSAIGIEVSVTGGLSTGGTLTLHYPSATVMLQTGLQFISQYVVQQAIYHNVVNPSTPIVVSKTVDSETHSDK